MLGKKKGVALRSVKIL
uniref:Uncharacterized protein n=1 Tax=Anguilla anguilla TaxID=7936 RepID=A0A0E9VNN7_ANGAN